MSQVAAKPSAENDRQYQKKVLFIEIKEKKVKRSGKMLTCFQMV